MLKIVFTIIGIIFVYLFLLIYFLVAIKIGIIANKL